MASLNIVSLPKHIDELRIFISDQTLDILAINETSLDSSINNQEINLPGYDIIRKDINRNGGGVCIYIRSSINYKLRTSIVPDTLECLCIEICKQAFETFIGRIDCENKDSYILGDLNCDMLAQGSNGQANSLNNICDIYQYTQIITQPTRITQNSSTLIDLILTNAPDKIVNSGVLTVGFSDHDLVYAYRKISRNQHTPKYRCTRQFKKFNADNFRNDLQSMPWPHWAHENIDDMWHEWKTNFLNVANIHAPMRKRQVRNKPSPWITTNLKSEMP